MKKRVLLCLSAVFALSCHGADQSAIGFLPSEKVAAAVEVKERNPFGKKVAKAVEQTEEKGTEETQIRGVFATLGCSGIMHGAGKTKILLGSMEVEDGGTVPPVIAHQTETLKVISVQKDRVQLSFVEKDGSTGIRKIDVPYDLTPSVRYKLGTNPEKPAAALGGVIKKNDPAPSPR